MSTNLAPPAKGAPKGGGLKAKLTRNKKPLLILGAAVVVVLALVARKQKAGDPAAATGVSGDGIYAAGTTSTPSGYVAGSGTYDSSITDVYNAMQKQLDKFMDVIPVSDPYATSPVGPDLGRALSATDRIVDPGGKDVSGGYFRIESDGTMTHITPATMAAYRLTDAGKAHKVEVVANTWPYTNATRNNEI